MWYNVSMKVMERVAVHHTGGLLYDQHYSSQHFTAEDIDLRHWQKWAFKSRLNRYGGYNLFIDRKGILTQFRVIGEETAAQRGFNLDTISICLAGNFTMKPNGDAVDKPTFAQIITLQSLLIAIVENRIDKYNLIVDDETDIDVKLNKIVPHRSLGQTNCYGSYLKDNWARELTYSYFNKKLVSYITILDLLTKLLDLLMKSKIRLGGEVRVDCCLDKDNRG